MCDVNKTRFRRAEEALRFYFRVRELLHSGRATRLVADELPAEAFTPAASAIDDYQCIGWCMRGLDAIALWLLSEIYGPTGFGVHRRTFSHACAAGRREFPGRHFRLPEVAMVHERALGVVKRGLRRLGMIPVRRIRRPLRSPHREIRTVGKSVHLHDSHAACRECPYSSSPAAIESGLFRAVKIPVRLRATGTRANGIGKTEPKRKFGE